MFKFFTEKKWQLWSWLGSITILLSLWLQVKIALVALLVVYHIYCGKLLNEFKQDSNRHSHVWFRWFNEAPVLMLVAVVILVVVKPF